MPSGEQSFGQRYLELLAEEIARRSSIKLPPPTREEKMALLDRLHQEEVQKAISAHSRPTPTSPPSPASKTPENGTCSDEEWLRGLEGLPEYKGIDVRRELERCMAWAKKNDASVSRRTFENWLKKAEAPIKLSVTKSSVRTFQPILEPRNWRQWVEANAIDPSNARRQWSDLDRSAQQYISSEMAKQP